jgi:hypothetical protein
MFEENKSFQWIKGDHLGLIEKVSSKEDDVWVYFESGRRINKSIANEFLVSADDDSVIPFDPIEQVLPQIEVKQKIKRELSPIDSVVVSLKDVSLLKQNVEVKIEISVPKPEVYNLLQESFGEEIFESIFQGVLDKLNVENLKEQLEKSLDKKLKNLYK